MVCLSRFRWQDDPRDFLRDISAKNRPDKRPAERPGAKAKIDSVSQTPGRPEGLLKGPFCKEQSRKKALGESGSKKRTAEGHPGAKTKPDRAINPKLNSSNTDERSVATMPNRSTTAKDKT